jgi:glycosyltransferase involved in cell wall biosynthesis
MLRTALQAAKKVGSVPILHSVQTTDATTPNRPVSVVMIVKDCADGLARCLQSLREKFVLPCDEILVVDTGSQDGGATIAVARKYLAKVIERPELRVNIKPFVEKWMPEHLSRYAKTGLCEGTILDFAAARQIATDAAAHDIQFWIDSDDTLEETNPGRLRLAINRFFEEGKEQIDQIFMDYHYAHSEDGQISSILKRERVFNRKLSFWKGRCHETAIPNEGVNLKSAYFQDLGSNIKHHKTPDDRGEVNPSDIRNYVILRKEIEETEPRPDPRTLFYLANSARGIGHDAEAIELYKRFIPISGNRDDVYAAHYYIATTFAGPRARRPVDALDWYFKCLQIKPEDPRGYFGIQRSYFQLGKWNESNHWYHCGSRLPEPVNQLHNYDPRHIKVLPLQVLAACAKEQNDREGAIDAMNRLIAIAPEHPETKALQQFLGNWIAGVGIEESVIRIIQNAAHGVTLDQEVATKLGRQVTSLLPAIPESLEKRGFGKAEPSDERPIPKRDIAIFCGYAPEEWGPRSGETGIGGSEKAVVMMAPRLQKLGFRVTVFANVPVDQRGIDVETGVRWEHFGSLEMKRPRDIAIFWRSPEMLEMPIPANMRILWCHDVQCEGRWTRARAALADQVWVLSNFHASTLPSWVRAELGSRLIVTRNGIDRGLFKEALSLAKGKRNPRKIIYASSPDRGVMSAIRIFQAANIPGATLHIFYGFTKMYLDNAARYEYAHVPDLGQDTNLYRYMQGVHQAIDADDRIVMPGRVGWKQLAAEMVTAGVWLYPTRFPEISCMSAMEAQAAGLVPVCTDYGALAETVLDKSFKITPEIDSSIVLFNATQRPAEDPERTILSDVALRAFDYDTLATEWAELFK